MDTSWSTSQTETTSPALNESVADNEASKNGAVGVGVGVPVCENRAVPNLWLGLELTWKKMSKTEDPATRIPSALTKYMRAVFAVYAHALEEKEIEVPELKLVSEEHNPKSWLGCSNPVAVCVGDPLEIPVM